MAQASERNGGYGRVKSSTVEIPKDEPVYVLRATDPYAVHLMIDHARKIEREGADTEFVDAIVDTAMEMSEWQRENPEKVDHIWK